MFYDQKTIHVPDSPRMQNMQSWLADKAVKMPNEYLKAESGFKSFDHRDKIDQIAHGFVYVNWDTANNRLTFLFKHKAGIYDFHSPYGDAISIPLPELTIYGYGSLSSGFDHFRADRIGIGTKYIPLLPLTNNYDSTFDQLGMTFTKLCDGGVLDQLTQNSGSVIKILNKLANSFTPFLTSYSNMDLSLPRSNRYCQSSSAYIADYIIDDSDYEMDESSDHQYYYSTYWRYLHTIRDFGKPDDIYERLSHMNSRDSLSEFGISRSSIDDACRGIDLEFEDQKGISMFEELKNFTTPTRTVVEHQSQPVVVRGLETLVNQKLIFLPIVEGSPLYDETDFREQYEPVSYQNGKVIHYTLQSGSHDTTRDVTHYLQDYFETGKIHPDDDGTLSDIHRSPLPVYGLADDGGEVVPCVLLKSGVKALLHRDYILEGIRTDVVQ